MLSTDALGGLDVCSETLKKIMWDKVEKGSKVYTDQFRSYSSLLLDDYKQVKIEISTKFYDIFWIIP